jgi:hypothetical protein
MEASEGVIDNEQSVSRTVERQKPGTELSIKPERDEKKPGCRSCRRPREN